MPSTVVGDMLAMCWITLLNGNYFLQDLRRMPQLGCLDCNMMVFHESCDMMLAASGNVNVRMSQLCKCAEPLSD